ncbi:TIGR01841 family phasin [Paraburkholderia phenazinium]|uniref:TIGR01841 family phasin n=1 Tax=Paraburkholderia phenazinium TaxID=60549 RepID=UPI00158D4938|nr:TIGR01841 family phasin [Paraburkholderia phenazinium]
MFAASNPFTDLAKLFARINVPGVDMASMIAAHRSDIDALATASLHAHEGMQILVHKQMEYLITTMREIQTTVQRTDVGDKPTVTVPQSCEFVAQTLHKAFERMRELTDRAQISQAEALAAISEGVQGRPVKRPRHHCQACSERLQRRQSLHFRRPRANFR